MEKVFLLIVVLLLFAAVDVIAALVRAVSQNPFTYPYFDQNVDVTGKKNADLRGVLTAFFWTTSPGRASSGTRRTSAEKERYLETCRFRGIRRRQYGSVLDDGNGCRFTAFRRQTRYRQINYQRHPYCVNVVDQQIRCSFQTLSDRRSLLLGTRMQTKEREEEMRQLDPHGGTPESVAVPR